MASFRQFTKFYFRSQKLLLRNLNGNKNQANASLLNLDNGVFWLFGGARSITKGNKENYNSENNTFSNSNFIVLTFLTLGFSAYYLKEQKQKVHLKEKTLETGSFIPNLPSYSLEDVAKHDTVATRVWVTYKQGVYDITEFVHNHPGGDKILMAAGGSVEPFWLMYAVHNNPQILDILEQHRIGNISVEDAKVATSNMEDPYSNEPRRHPALKPSSNKPFNAEPPPALLTDSFITPTDLFYVRNHLPVPDVDEKSYMLEISGVGVKNVSLTLHDIKKFPKYTVTAAIQCAGNRRSEMSKVKTVKGLDWGSAAIGNAVWSGARLYDVLTSLGLKEDDPRAKHIQFEGLDTDVSNSPYGASIPVEKGMDPRGDVLLAYEMNGQPLSRDHGYPIRVVVPGIVGARNVKWLGSIVVSEEESDSHWQQNDYKGFSPSTDWHNVDFKSAPAIQELPVISAIGEPSHGANVRLVDSKLQLKGYAFSGGGHKIVRVDVTADGGRTWHVAQLTDQDKTNPPRHWAWTLWHCDIPINPSSNKVEVWVKAVDNSYNTQPESFINM
ncbi:sulfite oxidase isoform X3 [Macrosteles quadrilineatus]|uniref:sulfite oxidase isoform X2 n=1 Tax=Macrosteles quadrilineatus TaxID=74068 RepID=UPI0023E196E8|nr:sulfite oxidase isoform X2 [Macrosteles quadrilineatus]XP_054259056.1 sulfite oxidase isoform X3 [Macrosteles quadrilineatus]